VNENTIMDTNKKNLKEFFMAKRIKFLIISERLYHLNGRKLKMFNHFIKKINKNALSISNKLNMRVINQ